MTDFVKYGEISDILNTSEPKDKLLLFILFNIVAKTCHKENDCYSFSIDDESKINDKIVMGWVDLIHKIESFSNLTVVKKSKQKLLLSIRHLCKNLEHIGISFVQKVIPYTNKDNKQTTKRVHYVTGLNI